jgi:PAS domain S-box-containing protein
MKRKGLSPTPGEIHGSFSTKAITVRRALLITEKTEVVTEVRQVLEARDYEVIVVPHRNETLTHAEEILPEVILLHMTSMDSRETQILHGLARRGITKQVGVILLLDGFGEESVARALEEGAADYIGMPFDPERLARRVGVLARIRQEARKRWDILSGQEELPDHVPYGMFLSTREGRLVKVNQALARMLGYESKEELVGIDAEREVYWNSRDSQLFQDILERQGVVENFPVQLRRKDGQKITVFVDGRSVRDAGGTWVGYAAMRVEQREPYRLTDQEREGSVAEPPPKTEAPEEGTWEEGRPGPPRTKTTDRGGVLRRLLTWIFSRRGEHASRLKAPELIGGRFEKIERLGIGSYGEIWKVREAGQGEGALCYVAKIPRSKKLNYQIQREAAICERLEGHPNAVAMVELVEDRDRMVLVQEFVEGPTLRELLERPLSEAERESIALQVIDVAAHAHGNRIVHRDIKPENIIVRSDGVVKLLDYGAAKELKDRDVSSTMVGSRPFMAPEQIMGESQIASDVWALGVIVYALYTEHLPFYHDNEKVLMDMILTLEPEPPRSLDPEIPAALEEIILRCLKKDPRDRYRDAGALKEALLERFPGYGHGGGSG